jgi:hypothetical protein
MMSADRFAGQSAQVRPTPSKPRPTPTTPSRGNVDGTRVPATDGPPSPGGPPPLHWESWSADRLAQDAEQRANDRRNRPAEMNRRDPQPSLVDQEITEPIRSMPRLPDGSTGSPETFLYKYYTYKNMPMSQAESLFSELPRWAIDQFAATAYQLGRYRGEKSATGLYQDALAISQARAMQGEIISPQEVLAENIRSGIWPLGEEADDDGGGSGSRGRGGGGGFGGGGGNSTVKLSTPQQARFYVEQAYKSILGRKPTAEEIDRFVAILREAEMNNPVTATYSGGTAVQTGGFEPQILAEQMAKSEEDYQSRSANQYYNWFIDALAGG